MGDFGLAKVRDHPAHLAVSLVGTPYYLAPELCSGVAYGDSADMWAFGVLACLVASLEYPFKGRNQACLVLKIVSGELDSPLLRRVERDHGSGVAQVVSWCLRKAPEQRPGAAELLSQLGRRAGREILVTRVPQRLPCLRGGGMSSSCHLPLDSPFCYDYAALQGVGCDTGKAFLC